MNNIIEKGGLQEAEDVHEDEGAFAHIWTPEEIQEICRAQGKPVPSIEEIVKRREEYEKEQDELLHKFALSRMYGGRQDGPLTNHPHIPNIDTETPAMMFEPGETEEEFSKRYEELLEGRRAMKREYIDEIKKIREAFLKAAKEHPEELIS